MVPYYRAGSFGYSGVFCPTPRKGIMALTDTGIRGMSGRTYGGSHEAHLDDRDTRLLPQQPGNR